MKMTGKTLSNYDITTAFKGVIISKGKQKRSSYITMMSLGRGVKNIQLILTKEKIFYSSSYTHKPLYKSFINSVLPPLTSFFMCPDKMTEQFSWACQQKKKDMYKYQENITVTADCQMSLTRDFRDHSQVHKVHISSLMYTYPKSKQETTEPLILWKSRQIKYAESIWKICVRKNKNTISHFKKCTLITEKICSS